jgi:hypothetical protein
VWWKSKDLTRRGGRKAGDKSEKARAFAAETQRRREKLSMRQRADIVASWGGASSAPTRKNPNRVRRFQCALIQRNISRSRSAITGQRAAKIAMPTAITRAYGLDSRDAMPGCAGDAVPNRAD